MKIYTGYPSGITKISKDKDFYQTEDLSNVITVYVNQADVTGITYSLVLEFLRADGRKTTIYTEDAFAAGDDTTLTEDGITYDIHNFTLTDTQLAVAGTLAFTCYINILNSGVIEKRGVLFNAVSNIRKTVTYSANTIFVVSEDEDDVPIIVADMKTAIETLSNQLTGKVNTSSIADDLTTNDSSKVLSAKQGKVLKDTIDALDDAKADKANTYTKTESDNTFAPKTTAITHTGNQLQDYSGNNIYPVIDSSVVYHSGNQLKDASGNDFYPNIDMKYTAINGKKIENINGNINLFDYSLVNAGISNIASDGTITETNSANRFYNHTPIHLKVGDYIQVPEDNNHRFYIYYAVNNVWTSVNGWKFGVYTISVEGDYIICFSTADESDDYLTLIKNSYIFYAENDFTKLLNDDNKFNSITNQYAKIRYPKNILDNSKLKIGYKRVWNNPTVLSEDASYVTFDFLEVYETGTYYLGRGNGTAQAPNPLIVWDKSKSFVRLFVNGETLEKGQYISITLGLNVYNAWKNGLIMCIGTSASSYYVPYFNPFYIVKNMLNSKCVSVAHQGINVDTTQQYGRNLLSSYVNASELGFNYGECDVIFTSDNVPVCCHDATFVDQTTNTTITIGNETYDNLITYNYYGGTIASLDEVVKACKENGMGLCIDHMYVADTDSKLNAILAIIDKYRMADNIIFFVGGRSIVQSIQAWDKRAKIFVPLSNLTIQTQVIGLVEEYHNDYNETGVIIDYSVYTIENLKTLNGLLPPYAKVYAYTIDSLSLIEDYKPYVNGVISNVLTVNN